MTLTLTDQTGNKVPYTVYEQLAKQHEAMAYRARTERYATYHADMAAKYYNTARFYQRRPNYR